ncbi:EamA family transporter [Methylophilus sp. 3sh_L]|uniref:EamA family transporter n=1 Tax=Methylophilus sp. 3sh_L TaxID=3377114 RepID=UPI00398EB5D1
MMIQTGALFVAAVLLDTLGTTLFKLGAMQPEAETSAADSPMALLKASLTRWHVTAGLLVYVVEYVIWITYLSASSLSQAFPMYSITIVLIMLVSRLALNEQIGKKRWLGALLIVAGVGLLGSNT